MSFRQTRPRWFLRSLDHFYNWKYDRLDSWLSGIQVLRRKTKCSRLDKLLHGLVSAGTFLLEVWQWAGWTRPAHPTSTPLAEKLAPKAVTPPYPSPPHQKKKIHSWKVSEQLLMCQVKCCIANSANIQPIWNAWDIRQMITHSLKAAWKRGKTPCCRRFNGKIKSKEEKDEEVHNINKLKETSGEKNQLEFGRRK